MFIDGAKPGDAVKIDFGGFAPSGFGWTANIPGVGLLADAFPDPELLLDTPYWVVSFYFRRVVFD